MEYTTQHHQIGLTLLSGIGSRRARLLLTHFNNLEEFFKEKKLNLAKIPGVPPDFISVKQRKNALEAADKIVEELNMKQTYTVFLNEKKYPRRLRQCEDAPLLLYVQGEVDFSLPKVVSIVGTRNATNYGEDLTNQLIADLRQEGLAIVSGMAYGIDVIAHRAAVQNKIPTWAVLGHGFQFMYPAIHKKLAEKIKDEGGCLISEFIPSQKPEPAHFPMRNRIVAGLADATVVIESGISGGSLITANLALDYNRDVFAFPGDIGKKYSSGCLKLIKENKAKLICSAQDVITEMSWEATIKTKQQQLFVELNELEERICSFLREKDSHSLDNLTQLLKLPVSAISKEMLSLQLKGIIKSLPGNRFSII